MARNGAMKIKVGDQVVVTSGKDRGARGPVLRVIPETQRVVVEKVNIIKRHTKARPPANPQQAAREQPTGGVIEKEAPIHVSNVQIVCPATNKPTRVGYRSTDDGRKIRISKRQAGVDIDK